MWRVRGRPADVHPDPDDEYWDRYVESVSAARQKVAEVEGLYGAGVIDADERVRLLAVIHKSW